MPHISKRKINKDTEKLIDSAFVWIFSKLKSNEVNFIFASLLTPTERLMLAKRLGVLFLLEENKTEPTIAETLKVTQATVSRIKLQHKLVSPQASNFLFRKFSNWHEFTIFKNAMQELALKALKTFSRSMAGKV